MANPTTNFGWVMPTSSSLVTNLPADFNTFGQAVDTSMSELLGGTTGQVLSKTSNTNMDFTWVTPTDQTPLTTKGDLFTFTTVDARLGVGTNGQVLQADSTAATGLKWATASAGFNTGYAYTATRESTTSTSYVSLTTATAVTVTTGTKALVSIKAELGNQSVGDGVWAHAGFAISGATTVSAADEWSISHYSQGGGQWVDEKGAEFVITGLTAGSNTFTMKFSAAGGYATPAYFANRSISVVDLGS